MIQNPKDYTSPFSALLVENIKRARAEREQRAEIYRETKEVVERAFGVPDPSSLAAAVIRAGKLRRGEIPDDTPRFSNDEHGRFAKAVINAGRRRRGEEELK